jgi:RNA polymerase sigma factor (sigma-70 family)
VSGDGLVGRVLDGDWRAIERLVGAAWPRAGLAHTGGVEASDLRQEACAELIAAARSYDPARDGDFADLAVARVRRRLGRLLRAAARARRRLPTVPLDGQALAGEPSDTVDAGRNPRLARALARLSPRLRAVIVRSFVRGMSDAEIAAEYRLSRGALERARRRAAAQLRAELRRGRATMPPG